MEDENSFSSKSMSLERPQFRGSELQLDVGKLDKVYTQSLPVHKKTQPRTSIIKTKFTSSDQKDKMPIMEGSSNSKPIIRPKSSTKSRFSICKSPIVEDETTGALIEFSTGTDISPSQQPSLYLTPDPHSMSLNTYHTVSGAGYRSRYSPQRSFEPLKSERSIERRLRRVTETEEDLPSPIKSPSTQQPSLEQLKEETVSPTLSRFSITKSSIQPTKEVKYNPKSIIETPRVPSEVLSSSESDTKNRSHYIKATSPSTKSKKHSSSKEMLSVPRKSLLKHSSSVDSPDGGSSGSSSCSSVASNKSQKTTKVILRKVSKELAQEEIKSTIKPGKNIRSSNVSFGKEVIYLDGEPVSTPPPTRERSRSDASATLSKLRHLTFSRGPKDPSSGNKMAWLKEKQSTAKNAKETDSTRNISGEIKPTHKRTHSADVSSSAGNTTNTKIIDVSLDKPPEKPRPRTRSEKLQKSPKTKGVLEEVSTKTSFDWPLGRLGKLRQKYTRNKKQSAKTTSRRKSKVECESKDKLTKRSKSIEAISKAHHPLAVSSKKQTQGKEEAEDLVYELPTHYQTVLPVIKSRVIRPVMGLFRQNSSKSKLKKSKRDRQKHPSDSEAGIVHTSGLIFVVPKNDVFLFNHEAAKA